MTTTLRPDRAAAARRRRGAVPRATTVCVNSRPVGGDPARHGRRASARRSAGSRTCGIEEPDRRRGRGTVAALAAEEVLRGWGCRRIEVDASRPTPRPALRLATALGYIERSRNMDQARSPTTAPAARGQRGARP